MEWWKLDEAANSTRVGSVNSIPLICSANVTSVAGGKYGNATSLESTSPGPSATCNNVALPVAGLAYAGNGIDAFVWLDIATVSTSDTTFLLTFTDSAGVAVWTMQFNVRNPTSVEYEMTGGSGGSIALGSSSPYRLFEIYYDPVLTQLGFRINNGAVMDQSVIIPAPPVTAKGSVSLTYNRITAGTSSADACELAIYPAILNSTQRAYIYNAGLGRSWPNSLP